MQISLFDGKNKFKIDKPIRLIELFAGYGSQHFALEYLGVQFESWKICEWAVKSIQAYKDAHFENDNIDYSNDLTREQVFDYLAKKGISANYSEPMTFEQIKRLGEEKARKIYNNIKATHNLVNIQQVRGEDLQIVDVDKYCYVMTYSFPCQDLSLAGLGAGMEKGSGTRSGMLWEVERILEELKQENRELPQVLVMENVPQVHGTKNKEYFLQWIKSLEKLGYSNFWQDLNAKDYDMPQNRKRCFMVSVLGDYYYYFPKKQYLEFRLKDFLESDVEESYYLSDSKIKSISQWKAQQDHLKNIDREKEICPCLTARGAGEEHSGMVLINEDVYNLKKKLYDKLIQEPCLEQVAQIEGTYESTGRVYSPNGLAPTINTCGGGNREPKIIDDIYGYGGEVSEATVINNYRIRKLTPKECFRLMGVKDKDFERIAQNQSNSSLYHLAGDSIVADVLMAIFKEML